MHFYLEPGDGTRYEFLITRSIKGMTPCYVVATQFSKLHTVSEYELKDSESEILSRDYDRWSSHYLIEQLNSDTRNSWTSRAILLACIMRMHDDLDNAEEKTLSFQREDYER